MEITSVDDDVYVNVVGSPLLLISFPVEMGWWRYDDLLAQFGDDSAVMLGFQALVENAQFPHSLPVEDDLILSVTEQAPEVIDDVEMRVFMLEMDAQFILLRSTGATEEEIQDYLEDEDNADFLAASQQTIMYRLWIGADDGLLYQGEGEGYSYMPYDSTDQFGVDYDIESEFTFSFTITGYGNTEAITAPDELHSGE